MGLSPGPIGNRTGAVGQGEAMKESERRTTKLADQSLPFFRLGKSSGL